MVIGNLKDFMEVTAVFPLPGLYDPFGGRWMVDRPSLKPLE